MAETGKTAIIVTLITVAGGVGVALIGNWDKLFGSSAKQPVAVQSSLVPGAGADPGLARLHDSQGAAYKAAGDALDSVTRQIEAANTRQITGRWNDGEGNSFIFTQAGNDYHFDQYNGGAKVGDGDGRLTGRRFVHSFRHVSAGRGTCEGELSPDAQVSAGRCISGGQSWPFRVTRE